MGVFFAWDTRILVFFLWDTCNTVPKKSVFGSMLHFSFFIEKKLVTVLVIVKEISSFSRATFPR